MASYVSVVNAKTILENNKRAHTVYTPEQPMVLEYTILICHNLHSLLRWLKSIIVTLRTKSF
jgi:hypothetical protein